MQHTFCFRLDEKTHRRLDELSHHFHRTRSNLVRWLIRQEYFQQGLNTLEKDGFPSPSELENLRPSLDGIEKAVRG